MRMEEMMKELFKRGDEKESRAHDHLCQRQKSNNYYNQDADDDKEKEVEDVGDIFIYIWLL